MGILPRRALLYSHGKHKPAVSNPTNKSVSVAGGGSSLPDGECRLRAREMAVTPNAARSLPGPRVPPTRAPGHSLSLSSVAVRGRGAGAGDGECVERAGQQREVGEQPEGHLAVPHQPVRGEQRHSPLALRKCPPGPRPSLRPLGAPSAVFKSQRGPCPPRNRDLKGPQSRSPPVSSSRCDMKSPFCPLRNRRQRLRDTLVIPRPRLWTQSL